MASSKAEPNSDDHEKAEIKNEAVACSSSSGKNGDNKVVNEEETKLDRSPIADKSEEEDEDRSFWAQYYCTTCQWLLGGAEGLLQHNRYFGRIDSVTVVVQPFLSS